MKQMNTYWDTPYFQLPRTWICSGSNITAGIKNMQSQVEHLELLSLFFDMCFLNIRCYWILRTGPSGHQTHLFRFCPEIAIVDHHTHVTSIKTTYAFGTIPSEVTRTHTSLWSPWIKWPVSAYASLPNQTTKNFESTNLKARFTYYQSR